MTSLLRADYGTTTTRWPVVVEMSVSSALLLIPHFGPGRRAVFEAGCDRRITSYLFVMALINGGSI